MKRLIVIGALALIALAFARSFGWLDRHNHQAREWTWRGDVPADGWVHVRNSNGPVKVRESSGSEVEIEASKSWKGRRPQDVTFVANRIGDDIYICALYGGDGECDEKRYRSSRTNWFERTVLNVKPVTVSFTLRVPRGHRVDVKTVNGGVSTELPLPATKLETVNGSITMREPAGAITAKTVNGRIRAKAAPVNGQLGDVIIENVNGSISLELPDSLNADVRMETVNGRISSDLSFASTSRSERREMRGTLGAGGSKIALETVNGSVSLKRLGGGEGDDEVEVRVEASGTPAGAAGSGSPSRGEGSASQVRVAPAPPPAPEAPRRP